MSRAEEDALLRAVEAEQERIIRESWSQAGVVPEPGDDGVRRRLRLVLCRLGLHNWSRWYKVRVHHMGEYPWDTWQHVCMADKRECLLCGKGSRRCNSCQGPVLPMEPQG
jgi:hypothetical protein